MVPRDDRVDVPDERNVDTTCGLRAGGNCGDDGAFPGETTCPPKTELIENNSAARKMTVQFILESITCSRRVCPTGC